MPDARYGIGVAPHEFAPAALPRQGKGICAFVPNGSWRVHGRNRGSFWNEQALANSASLTTHIASKYAGSLFELAVDSNSLDETEKGLERFDDLIRGSEDLARMLRSPVFSASEQIAALNAILAKAGIGGLVANFVRVVARNRRLFAMRDMLAAYRLLLAEHSGEEAADVTVARKLAPHQKKQLQKVLRDEVGKDVSINEVVDPALLGGMIVKVGSRQIDTSLRTKLSSLKLALKEVG